MLTNTTEKGLESHITNHLCLANTFEVRNYENYNKADYADIGTLFKFLEDTQPKDVTKLKSIHGDNYRQKILYRINQKIKDQTVVNENCIGGIVNLLRKGITDNNVNLKLFYDKPVSILNEKDSELYHKNIFSVMRQVHYSQKNENSLDLVIFINGLPVITFELKNELTNQNVKDAIKQYKTSRDPKEELFRLGRCIVHIAVDTDQVWMCTNLQGENSTFLPFNKGYNNGAGNPPNGNGIKTDYLWKEILTKDSLTNIIQNYIQLIEEETEKILPSGEIKKQKERKLIFPRYHQLDSVRKILNHAKEKGTGNKYLIQHSAGSGKSNSISWLAHQLVGLHTENTDSVVTPIVETPIIETPYRVSLGQDVIFDSVIVVTDRRVLDTQIRKNVKQFEQVKGVVEAITEGSKQLKTALEEGKKIIITTIQKFPYIVNEIGELPGNKFAIIIDEAHSSQSGNTAGKLNTTLSKEFKKEKNSSGENIFTDKNHDELTTEDLIIDIIKSKKMLPNASYFAFTATPKNKTLELFGEKYNENGKEKFRAFHMYSMKQAIEENFILDVLQNYTTYQSSYRLLKKTVNDPKYDHKKAKKKLKYYVESHDHTIGKKAALMIEHFMEEVINKGKIKGMAKAMIVTSSRKNAVKYKKAFDKYLAKTNNKYKAIVAFSGDINKETESSINHFSSALIPEEFKKSENRFLIVANKFQTGFDQPLLHTMYVDKILGGVSAVQTLSRLNRTTSGKSDTFILDFVNSTEDIKNSFEPYYETTILGESTDPNKLFDLQNALDNYQVYSPDQVKNFSDKMILNRAVDELHAILDSAADTFRTILNDDQKEDFRTKCKSYVRLYAFLSQIVPFENPYLERLYLFLKHLQNKIPKAEEDLAKDILDNIDMDSYKLKKESETSIYLKKGEEIKPTPVGMRGSAFVSEKEYLSNIVMEFNERFGTSFTNEDKVRKMTNDLMDDIMTDNEAVNNINDSLTNKDFQNAKITFADVLKEKIIKHIDSNFEVFKEYNDNEEFRAYFAGMMFEMMMGRNREGGVKS